MLYRIGHQCRSLLRLPFPSLNPSTLILTKSSSLVSAESLELEPSTTSPATNDSIPSGILSPFKATGSSGVKFLDVKHPFDNLVSDLNSSQVDVVIDNLLTHDPDSAVELFDLLKNEHGFRHSRSSQFVIAHLLASKRQLKVLRSNFMQMLQEEGSGSGPSLCDLLSTDFKGWKANAIVWDILAFAYSRLEMVHDALSVIAKMKDFNIQPSILTYNSLLYNLRHSDSMWYVYNDIKESGIQESRQTNSILVDGLCKQSLIQEAVAILHGTNQVASFNTVMSSLSKLGFVDIAQSILCLMLKFGIQPDAYSYNILINGLCMAGSLEDALKLTNDMDKHGLEPDSITYNTLSKGFRVLGMINGASKMIQETISKGLNPNSITYTLLICGNCQEGKVQESLTLKNEMISKGYQLNYISYSVLVSSLCKIGRVNEALSLLYEMEIDGLNLKPDAVMYSIIIHGLCKQGDIHTAIQLYMDMCSKKIFPNVFTHRAVLLGLCERVPLSDARRHFDLLTSNNGVQDIVLYNIMINKYAKLGMNSECVHLYNQIKEKGIDPTIVTFNSLIHGFCKGRNLTRAMMSFDEIRVHGLSPTVITYTTLMNFFCEEGKIKEMLSINQEMESNRVEPTLVTYTVILKSLCKKKKLQESLFYLDNMLKNGVFPDTILYNVLIQSFCKAREFEKAFELHDEMMTRGLEPDAVTYNILINGLCVYGDLNDADKLFFHLKEVNFGLKKAAYTILVKAHCVKGDVDRGMMVFKEMVEMGFEVSVRDYGAVINRLCKRGLMNEVNVFLKMMFFNGVYPDGRIYTVILYGFYLVGDVYSRLELLPNMVKCGVDVC